MPPQERNRRARAGAEHTLRCIVAVRDQPRRAGWSGSRAQGETERVNRDLRATGPKPRTSTMPSGI